MRVRERVKRRALRPSADDVEQYVAAAGVVFYITVVLQKTFDFTRALMACVYADAWGRVRAYARIWRGVRTKCHIRFIARCRTAQAFIFLTTPYPYFLRFHRERGLTHPTIREIARGCERWAVEKFDFFFMSDRIDERALL